ncbi:hypothetical protein ABZ532_29310 [Streptomyces sp. NPDC019396]|uniref:hypothetical protein n=1 Tax=Streptomyces sp. NPDC019396 TaxID=3154687 RepID=UPI00340E9801
MTTNTDSETQVSETGVRDVSDFLADLDDVLATSTAPTIPEPATEPDPEPDAAATMPDVDLDLDVVDTDTDADTAPAAAASAPAQPPAPVEAPAPAAPAKDWWNDVYKDDAADQDTFTGNVPAPPTAPPSPKNAPAAAPAQPVVEEDADDEDAEDQQGEPEAKKTRTGRKKDQAAQDDDAEEADADDAPAPATTGGRFAAAVKNAGPVIAGTTQGGGLINNSRGRQVIFAGTAYAAGWSLHLDDWVTGLMAHADQYATPVAGCALGAGVLALAMRSKLGGVIFVSSLGLITALQMARPAWVVGGGVALGLQIAYRMVRGWVGHYGDKWPWKGVVWAAHVPAATATVAFLLYGTN